ncbi:MAG: AMP-binding protein [Sulfuricaulis sp.]|nr:AMP-binding protein [Sulfuricaulis sp.]
MDAFDPESLPLIELTIPRVWQRQARQFADKVFLNELWTGRTFTYREMDLWCGRVANALRQIGVRHGSHVGVLMENSAEHVAAFFGIGKIGAVSVPVNTAARGELLRYYLSQSECTTVIVDASLLGRLGEILAELPLLARIVVVGDHQEDVGTWTARRSLDLHDFQAMLEGAQAEPPDTEIKCHDLLMLAFTSGTTGPSKASMLSHAAALTYGTGAAEAQSYRTSDVFYVCLPLFHNNALLASLGSALVCGASVVLSRRFSVTHFWSDIRDSGATITNLLGAMTSFLWSVPPQADDRDNKLRLISMAPVPKYARDFEERFGLDVMSNYGLSDFGMATSYTSLDPKTKLGSIGRPRRGSQVKIVDDHDFELPHGQAGEIVLRCDEPWRAALGYYRMAEATLVAHRNQWFHTGDRGIRDEDGYIWFVDRKKDCIRRRGENISAFEVEQILMRHPDVAQVAVVAVTTATNDEEVAAVIVKHEGRTLDHKDIIEHCQRNMSYFMVPRYIQLRDELPTTVNQKIEKFRIKQELERDISQAWDREAAGVLVKR